MEWKEEEFFETIIYRVTFHVYIFGRKNIWIELKKTKCDSVSFSHFFRESERVEQKEGKEDWILNIFAPGKGMRRREISIIIIVGWCEWTKC